MEEKEQKVNEYIKELFNIAYPSKRILFDNLSHLKKLFLFLENIFLDFCNQNCSIKVDWSKISKLDFIEKEKIIEDFLKYLKIDFKMQDAINSGAFDISTHTVEEGLENNGIFREGSCSKRYHNPSIRVYNSGLVTDTVVWVHELSHYRNVSKNIFEVNDLLSETLAFTYEYIFLDFLESIGYNYEAKLLRFDETRNLFWCTYDFFYIAQLLTLYDNFGSINRENYIELYDDDKYYEESIEFFYGKLLAKNTKIFTHIEYALAFALSIYLYEEYKKDPSFIEKIEELNSNINSLSLEECLSIVRINNYAETGLIDEQNLKKIEQAINNFKNRLEQELETFKSFNKTCLNKQ